MFTMQTRIPYRCESFASIEAALNAGFALGVPFDVSAPSGAIVWVWEQR
jgi:hypothetical protein